MSTRDRLVSSAIELLTSGEPVSLDGVAAAAGVSRATAYRSISGLPDLLSSAFAQRAAHHVSVLQQRIAETAEAVASIEEVVVYTAEVLQSDPAIAALMPASGSPANDTSHKLALDVVRPIILEGQERGEIRADVDAVDIVDWLLDCFTGGLAPRNMNEAETRRMFRTFFVPALRPPATFAPDDRVRAAAAQHLRRALDLLDAAE